MSKVSILTPTYRGRVPVLRRCLTSVLRQPHTDFEQLVCSDGGFEDLAAKVVAEQHDERIRYLHTDTNFGGYGGAVRRWLLPRITGDYVAFLDDDNIFFPTFLEKMLLSLEDKPHAKFAICEILHHGPLHASYGACPVVLEGRPAVQHIDTMQVLVETAAMRQVGWQGNDYLSDGQTFEALGKAFSFARAPECLGVHY